jgi:Flp pilus assembly protein TadD
MKPGATRWKRWLFGSMLAVVVLGAGYYGSRHYAWPAFKAWRMARMNREARAFLTSGDLANALLAARKSLQASTQNPEAWHIAAEVSEARQLPEAVWYQDSLCRVEPTKKNYLELIRLALGFDVPAYALRAIEIEGKDACNDPEFHRLAAQVYERIGQPLAAKVHLIALTQLQPSNRTAQLDLAEIELSADPTRKDLALRARVLALSNQPDLRVRALTLLLRDNVAGRITAGTDEFVRRLQLEPGLDVPRRLLVIQGLFLLGQPSAPQLLGQLQAEVRAKPADVARVVEFLFRTGHAEKVQPWVATLPAATRGDEEVQHMVAEALLTLHDAPALEAFLRDGNWPEREYLREALLAHAYRDQGRSADFTVAWKMALIGTGSDLRKTAALLARVDEWRWVNEHYDVVWNLFALVPTNESVQQALIGWERHQGNTANLNRLFDRIVEVSPGDDAARNNLAYTSLLLGSNVARAGLIAEELANSYPKNPYYATTYALALYQQGHVAEALARLEALAASERAMPERMLFRAQCLAALGQAAPAADLMNGVDLTDMLPEEKHLADGVIAEIVRLDRVQGNRSRLLALRPDQNPGAAGWLALVATGTRSSATTDMKLADSLYAVPDWDGLQELLRSTSWKEQDYLRSALLAYVFRQHGDLEQSQEAWQQALALADQNTARLQDLRALAIQWKWAPERLETLNLVFEHNPDDRRLLAELLESYREAQRTPDLMRVLGLYIANTSDLSDTPDTTDEAVAHAYYSLLLDANIAHANVVARTAFEAAPADIARRMVYIFSLWKQHRAAEAMPLLSAVKSEATSDLVPISLLRATILAQLGDTDAARASLGQFNAGSALPEEVALADRISTQLSTQVGVVRLPLN